MRVKRYPRRAVSSKSRRTLYNVTGGRLIAAIGFRRVKYVRARLRRVAHNSDDHRDILSHESKHRGPKKQIGRPGGEVRVICARIDARRTAGSATRRGERQVNGRRRKSNPAKIRRRMDSGNALKRVIRSRDRYQVQTSFTQESRIGESANGDTHARTHSRR